VVPLAVLFCFLFLWMQIRCVGVPSMPPGHCQDLREAMLPYRQLNNLSCQNGNSAAHIPTGGATWVLAGGWLCYMPYVTCAYMCWH
jgi:hypothetical protein